MKFYRIKGNSKKQEEFPSISKFDFCKKTYNVSASILGDSIKYKLWIKTKGVEKLITLFEDDDPESVIGWLNEIIETQNSAAFLKTEKFQLFFESPDKTSGIRRIYIVKKELKSLDINNLKKLSNIQLIDNNK